MRGRRPFRTLAGAPPSRNRPRPGMRAPWDCSGGSVEIR